MINFLFHIQLRTKSLHISSMGSGLWRPWQGAIAPKAASAAGREKTVAPAFSARGRKRSKLETDTKKLTSFGQVAGYDAAETGESLPGEIEENAAAIYRSEGTSRGSRLL
jgi:hypothetical protein